MVVGFGTLFNTELKIGDEITLVTDAGNLVTKIIESIISNTSLQLSSAVGGSDVSTKTVATRNRGKLQDPSKNIAIFKLPNDAVKTLKTTTNSGLTDTNFNVRRHFTGTLSSNGEVTISAGTNEVFGSLAKNEFFSESSNYSPRSPYAASKASSDHLVNAWYHTYRMPVVITNCSNNYGPYQNYEK